MRRKNKELMKYVVDGLETNKVQELRKKYGYNEMPKKRVAVLSVFLKKVFSPIPLMIEAALVLSAITRQWEDFTIIALLLVVNITVDFVQEHKATKALAALKKTLAREAVVLRDGSYIHIPARELVPGDIIKLKLGDIVPADSEVFDGEVSVQQAVITGESFPVSKKCGDTLYSSSIIARGTIIAKVVKIGKNTFIGTSAHLVFQAQEEKISHFQKTILSIGTFLIFIATVLIIITFITLIHRGDSLIETLRFSLVLAIASVPVALPTVLSVTMAIGAHALAKSRAIVSNFTAIEELAGVDRLCVDKTGTLTKNEIEITKPKAYGVFSLSDLFTYTQLVSEKDNKTRIEAAITRYALENDCGDISDFIIDDFTPFNPTDKITAATAHKKNDKNKFEVIMGAPQKVIERLTNKADKMMIQDEIEEYAQNGFRVLLVVVRVGDNSDLVPVGILPLLDPPREDSLSVMQNIRKHRVIIKMITGDNSLIALYISKLLSIGTKLMRAKELHNIFSSKDTKNNTKAISEIDIFAEVTPKDKYNIISALQSRGHIVAMTGDGINDAPALKKADVGIAVSGASPAAREAADLILLDSGLSVIDRAIVLARNTFARMQSYAIFRIAETIRIVFFISLAVLVFNQTPLSAAMIILLALLNDIPVMAIAYDNVHASEKPMRWCLQETMFISILLGIAGLLSSFLLLWWLDEYTSMAFAVIQTIIFLKLDVSGHSTLYVTRTGRRHFWEKPFPSLTFFLPAFSSRIIGTIIALFGILMEPISWKIIAGIWIYSTVWFVFNDMIKVWGYTLFDKLRIFLRHNHITTFSSVKK